MFPPDTNQTVVPFTVPEAGRTNLFLWCQDWTSVAENGNTTPDWWFYLYFATTAYTTSNLAVALGSTEGWHDVWIGLRGFPPDATQTWQYMRVKQVFTPPLLVVTNPVIASGAAATVAVPMIQLQGYCPEPLAAISYDLNNALGLVTNQAAGVTDQYYDPNTWKFTTN